MKSQLFSSAAFATTALFILSNAMPSNGQRQQFLRGKLYGYAAENDAECPGKCNFGYDDIPEGAEQMSGIPENLPAEIAGKLDKVDHDISDETFKNTLISAGKVPTLIDENNGIKSFYLFGDKGYKIPGYGGINNFDVFVAKDDFTLASFHDSFLNNVTGEPCTKAEYEAGSTECTWDTPDGRYNLVTAQTWWSNPKDSEGLSVLQSKDQVSQVCWVEGFQQGLQCTFKAGTTLVVGQGGPRATGNGSGCTENVDWADPQQVVDPQVYQYVLPAGPKSLINTHMADFVVAGSCKVCFIPANTTDVAAEFENEQKNCWPVPEDRMQAQAWATLQEE